MKIKTIITFLFIVSVSFVFISGTTSTQSLCDSPYVGGHTGAPGETGCNGCHAGTANAGNAIIDFDLGTSTYVPGQTYQGFIRIQQAGLDKFGFSCLALKNSNNTTIGTFNMLDTARIRTYADGNRNYVSHTPCGADSLNANSWSFTWTAPPVNEDTITLYIGALAANHNHATSGDFGYTRKIVLPVQTSNNIDQTSAAKLNIFPNPFFNVLTVQGLQNEKTTAVVLLDISGRTIIPSLPFYNGNHLSLTLNENSPMPSGTYFLKITTDKNLYIKKIIKL